MPQNISFSKMQSWKLKKLTESSYNMDRIPVSTIELICLGSSFAFSGLFCYLYRKKRATVQVLKEAPKFQINKQLVEFLNATPGNCVEYAVVEGITRPVGESLRSHYQDDCTGVMQRLILKEHKLIWNNLARSWNDSERIIHQKENVVPFDLISPEGGKSAIRVINPLEASGLQFETVYERFHQAAQGFTDIIGHYLSGEKPKGFLETEEIVRVGATLTGIGELVLDSDKIIKLQPPKDGLEYFLSTLDLPSILKQQESSVKLWKVLMTICTLTGIAVVMVVLRRMYHEFSEKQELEEMRKSYERFNESRRKPGSTADDEIPENACVICLSKPRECVFLTCGHVCCCYDCHRALPSPICPICRSCIVRVVPLYQA
ncbi:mitochondrial ubiquitin ligase activator of nfkb 1-A isoform X1 [Carcharodon carcharias]|uniref:mitochondrial ubiquitin ligase activator of nfkb 1-A isoform X1 n=2 Tax=Carcharodon carcharias TaxID=13397 RepID=UPI001B7E79F5|nr:mitochondrial ubiquitin ligase activator of nfkb 1-A isoform X1 [Carcharodon carcharias]XP_041038703.1 mitochondrial ubiquitin ligase activator of nfkb 1-A isoform X1 [Carcharodon carcharias]